MPLPRFVLIKSNNNHKCLGYVPPEKFKGVRQDGADPSRNSFLRFDRDESSNTNTKFELVPSNYQQGYDGLFHIKCCENKKYWVRLSKSSYWIVAAADKINENVNSWECTLFQPIYTKRTPHTVLFEHYQLKRTVYMNMTDSGFKGCLFGDGDISEYFTIINWKSMPTITSDQEGSDDSDYDSDQEGSDSDSDSDSTPPPRRTM